MKILILGAKGNLGTQLVQIFKDHEILAWDRTEADFLNLADLIVKLDIAKPEVIVNAAAYNAVDKCESDEKEKELAVKLNIELPAALAGWCKENDRLLVQYSTDYVFSGDEGNKEFNEDDGACPINIYGETKAGGEKAIIDSGCRYYLIRTSKLFGPSGQSEFSKKSFFDIMTGLAEKNPELSVVDEELSCFTYTPDLASATKQLIEEKYPFGIYHVVNERPVTWYGAVLELKDLLGFSTPVKAVSGDSIPRPARRPKFSILKNNKMPHLRPFDEALKEYLNI